MVAFYVSKIKEGTLTIDKVPKMWREKVKVVIREIESNVEG